ncbi:MAG: TatD family hydrolase [Simkaniaceae bacterium]|nr:TatD family hydrolase [Simkaniaceae bacterium]
MGQVNFVVAEIRGEIVRSGGMFCDAHAHLTCDSVFPLLPEVLERARSARIDTIVNICTDEPSLRRGIALREDVKQIYNVGATTPHDVAERGEADFATFERMAREGKSVAIGETGLDYHHTLSPKELQKHFLIRYLRLAVEVDLPVVIHCREAFDDLFALTEEHYPDRPLMLHCFTGTADEAKRALERGWYLSFSGIVTFKKSVALRETARSAPLERMVIETDTPYLAPEGKRGKSNEPSFLVRVAEELATVKGLSLEEVATVTSRNAKMFFRIVD